MKPLATVLFLLMCGASARSQQQLSTIEGTVTDVLSGQPVTKASIELRGQGDNPFPVPQQSGVDATTPGFPALTGDHGQFVLRNIPPGRYSLTAAHTGFVHGEYGQHGPNGRALILTVAPGQNISGIRLVMMRNGAISGHVVDSKGLPLAYVQMQARRIGYPDAQRTLTVISSTVTDDVGAYRLYGLPPGQYVLSAETYTNNVGITPVAVSRTPPVPGVVMSASAHGPMLTDADPANQNRRRDQGVTMFYPNVSDDRDATILEVRSGSDLAGIDVALKSVRNAASGGTVSITVSRDTASGNNNGQIWIINRTTQSLRTRFALMQVGPADAPNYRLNTSLPEGSYSAFIVQTDTARNVSTSAMVNFDIGSSPVSINLAMSPLPAISGRVSFEGNNADRTGLRINFRRTAAASFWPAVPPAVVQPDGTFTVQGLIDGDYIVTVNFPDALQDAFLKSVSAPNLEAVGNRIRVSSIAGAPSAMEVRLATNGGRLSGSTIAASGEKLSNVTVLLAPLDAERRDLFRSDITDSTGNYRFDRLPPGDYKLYAWEDVEPDIWFNPSFAARLQDAGEPVRITENGRQTVIATVIPVRSPIP